MKVTWTPARDEMLRRMWRDGVPQKEIAKATETTVDMVQGRSRKLLLGAHPRCTNGRRMNAKTKALIVEMRANGARLSEISRAVKFNPSTISLFLKGMEMPLHLQRETVIHVEIPQRVLEERERRYNLAPRDLTAMLLGDPLPGMSALERR